MSSTRTFSYPLSKMMSTNACRMESRAADLPDVPAVLSIAFRFRRGSVLPCRHTLLGVHLDSQTGHRFSVRFCSIRVAASLAGSSTGAQRKRDGIFAVSGWNLALRL